MMKAQLPPIGQSDFNPCHPRNTLSIQFLIDKLPKGNGSFIINGFSIF